MHSSLFLVCEKYLCQYPGDTELLWEVESIGWPNQRTNIASKIQTMDLSGETYQKRHCKPRLIKRPGQYITKDLAP